jgi:hypothetical protein
MQTNKGKKMKTRKFKIATWFIEDELCHKVSISYDHETERAYQLLDILYSKLEYDRRRKFNWIEITEEEYQTWYKYFLEYYIDDDSIYYRTEEYKEAKKLLRKLINFFGVSSFDESHRAGAKLKFVKALVDNGITLDKINTTQH